MAASKTDTQPATPAAAAVPAAAAAPAANGTAPAPAVAPSASPLKGWLPVIAALVLSPAITFATVEFVLLPRLTRQLTAAASADPAPAKEKAEKGGEKGGKEGKDNKEGYEFQSVVVNLAGTMGTRYLKTTFLVTGADAGIKDIFEGNKPRLTDVTLNVLSSLTLADLEEPGAKNVIREK